MEAEKLAKALSEPFDLELLGWKPQALNADKTQALVAPYADPRAYTDRLNDVLGPGGWEEKFTVVSVPFRRKDSWKADASWIEGTKVIVTCELAIPGLGRHVDVGEEETGDENVGTSAFAQAFKRACVKFGLGRYLYDFPKGMWAPYDAKRKQVTAPPPIPAWAKPKAKPAAAPTPKQSAPASGDAKVATISEGQRRRLFAMCKEYGIEHDALKDYLFTAHRIPTTKDIPGSLYAEVCTWISTTGQPGGVRVQF